MGSRPCRPRAALQKNGRPPARGMLESVTHGAPSSCAHAWASRPSTVYAPPPSDRSDATQPRAPQRHAAPSVLVALHSARQPTSAAVCPVVLLVLHKRRVARHPADMISAAVVACTQQGGECLLFVPGIFEGARTLVTLVPRSRTPTRAVYAVCVRIAPFPPFHNKPGESWLVRCPTWEARGRCWCSASPPSGGSGPMPRPPARAGATAPVGAASC